MLSRRVEHSHSSNCPDQVQRTSPSCMSFIERLSLPPFLVYSAFGIASLIEISFSVSRFEECVHCGKVSRFRLFAPQKVTMFQLFFSIEGIHRILVATSDGALYMGNIDPRDGGECRITKEFRLFVGPGDPPLEEEDRPSNVRHF